jgi:hypothetical protein
MTSHRKSRTRGAALARFVPWVAASFVACSAHDGGSESGAVGASVGTSAARLVLAPAAEAPLLTQHNDNGRTGTSVRDGITGGRVGQRWSWLATLPVDGNVYAQPLYIPQMLLTKDGRTHNTVFVATSHNHVYAFDADTYQVLWDNAGPHWDDADGTDLAIVGKGCANVAPGGIGILSTPVIDGASGTMYVSYRSLQPGQGALQGRQWIRRVETATGNTLGNDVEVTLGPGITRTPWNDTTAWDPGRHRQRASLLLDHGTLYLGFAMRCEEVWTDYHGWMFAYDVSGPGGVPQGIAALNTTPTSRGGGIWQANGGPSADAQGNVYFMTGNNTQATWVQPSSTELAGSFVRATVVRSDGVAHWFVDDTFTPYRADWQQANDMDLGSAAPVLVPGAQRIVGGGKEGILYVLDTGNLGGFDIRCDPTQVTLTQPQLVACGLAYDGSFQHDDPFADTVVQKIESVRNHWRTPVMNNWGSWPHVHGTPVVGAVAGTTRLYVWPEKDAVRSFSFNGSTFSDGPIGTTFAPDQGMPGGMLSLTTDAAASSGVLWASVPKDANGVVHGELFAYDPVTLNELWNNANDGYYFGKFVAPTVVDGKAFLATLSGEVLVYGERKAPASEIAVIGQTTTQLDLLTVGDDGSLVVSWEANGSPWQSPPVSITAPGFAPPGGGVAFARQSDHQIDAFVVGNDGAIYVTWVVDLGVWAQPVRLTATGFARPGAHLTTAHQSPTQLDLFVVDATGAVRVMWVEGLGVWQGPVSLTGTGFAPSGAALAADTQGSGQLDLFTVSNAGAPSVLWVVGEGIWQGPVALTGANFAPAGAGVTTAHQGSNQLDLFVVSRAGAPSVLWVVGAGVWQGPVALTGAQFAPPGASVSAAPQSANQIDLFVVANSGAPNVLWVVGSGVWQGPQPLSANGFAPAGAPVVAAPQTATQLDLLVGGYQHSVLWVQGLGTWQGPARIF